MQRAGRHSLKTGPGSEDLRQRAAKQGHRGETRRRRGERKAKRRKGEKAKRKKREYTKAYLEMELGDWRRIASKGDEGDFFAASFCLPCL